MLSDLIEEMKAKIAASCGMTLTLEETKEVLAALTSLAVVEASAPGVEAKKETLPETVVEREEDTTVKKGPLPEDFPGRVALAGAGINTFAQARKARDSEEGLTGITGVGDVTAKAIEEALN